VYGLHSHDEMRRVMIQRSHCACVDRQSLE
jgi:hypothetical protein